LNQHLDWFQISALLIALLCAIIDFRTTKIPNLITFPATLLGLILNFFFNGGWPALGNAAAGAVVGALITCVPKFKKLESIGFGDAKLMMAIGAFLGWEPVLLVFFYFCLCWGLSAGLKFLWLIPWGEIYNAIKIQNQSYVMSEQAAQRIQKMLKTPTPVAPFIAAGVLLAELFGDATLKFMGFS
jgi:prepilin signal peptidase PulO-like enzyme (type II secretory pathway)